MFLVYAYHIGGPSDVTRESIKQYGDFLSGNSPHAESNQQMQTVPAGSPESGATPGGDNAMSPPLQSGEPVPVNIPPVYTKPAVPGSVAGKTYSRR
ncbi:hypothetical protein [Desulfotomaculum copahuensis]|uniref:hypothetical protein n=1 Tax=Desulfotomaculum copahuensis TaxID=1838280 RepID=UPI001244C5DD|nr:hypothetical protein [Desulfotomaculum copahuensis]